MCTKISVSFTGKNDLWNYKWCCWAQTRKESNSFLHGKDLKLVCKWNEKCWFIIYKKGLNSTDWGFPWLLLVIEGILMRMYSLWFLCVEIGGQKRRGMGWRRRKRKAMITVTMIMMVMLLIDISARYHTMPQKGLIPLISTNILWGWHYCDVHLMCEKKKAMKM